MPVHQYQPPFRIGLLLVWFILVRLLPMHYSSTSSSSSCGMLNYYAVAAAEQEPEQEEDQEQNRKSTTTDSSSHRDAEEEQENSPQPSTYFTTTQQHLLHRTRVDFNDFDFVFDGVDDNKNDINDTVSAVAQRLTGNVQNRLTQLFQKTKTPECRALIAEHFGYFINGIGTEQSMPFGDSQFTNTCPEEVYDFNNLPEGMHIGMVQNRSYQPDDAEYIQDPDDLQLLYGILTHNDPNSTIRLIEQLYVSNATTTFVIHVDGKSDDTYDALLEYAATRRDYVHILPIRIRANWGGFSLVNCTLQILKYTFGLYPHLNPHPLPFHKFVHLASTSYPLVSNSKIRHLLADFPLDANLLHVIMKPTRPHPHAWHYFIECDDRLHRIYRLRPLWTGSGGIELFTASQWFILSYEFAHYLAHYHIRGTLVHDFVEYARYTVVADETFFGTILRNTEFCTKHHNWNFLHIQFDRWESDVEDVSQRDERKCMMPDPNHCGRSPTTMTMDYLDLLELTGDLFARKFIDSVDSRIKDVIDAKRLREEMDYQGEIEPEERFSTELEGHGTLFVARASLEPHNNGTHDNVNLPLCLGLGHSRNRLRLVPCFHEGVIPTLASGWETGAVILQETPLHNRWQIGPSCSSDGILHRLDNATMQSTPGSYSNTSPRCMLTQMDGIRQGRCADGEAGTNIRRPGGGIVQVYPCAKRWHQFWGFGNNTHNNNTGGVGSIFMSIPGHIVRRIQEKDNDIEQEAHLCLGVRGRGNRDEEDWVEEKEDMEDEQEPWVYPSEEEHFQKNKDDGLLSLQAWNGRQIVTTRCSNTDGVIEWLVVPFIEEEEEEEEKEEEEEEESESNETEEGGDNDSSEDAAEDESDPKSDPEFREL